jgi:hypothetical protein
MEPIPPEEIIQRLETGDPDPSLRKLVDQAAWQAFHDPWEKPPAEPKAIPEGDPMETEAIQPLTTDMIDAFLRADDFNFYTADWGFRLAFFRYGTKSDRVVRMTLGVDGQNKDILLFRLACDRRVDPAQFELAFRLCNQWQNEYRYPRAILELPDPPEKVEGGEAIEWNPSGSLVLDYQLPLPKGISQDGFNELVRRLIANSWDFWRIARERYGL